MQVREKTLKSYHYNIPNTVINITEPVRQQYKENR